MKSNEKAIAIAVGVLATALFTVLLVASKIGPTIYCTLILATLLTCLGISTLSRITEFNLKEMKLLLDRAEKVKAEFEAMYGSIEHLKNDPLRINEETYKELGLFQSAALVSSGSIVNYVTGCMRRERERFARIFVAEKAGDKLAGAILDSSLDTKVFKWVGPGARLDDPPPAPKS